MEDALKVVNEVLAPAALNQVGLKTDDIPAIMELARTLDGTISVSQFGRDVAEKTSRHVDDLLSQVRTGDLDETGQKLSDVVLIAKSMNLHVLSDRRSRIPLIGRFIDRLRMTKERFLAKFENAKQQIEGLVKEVQTSQRGLSERVRSLESLFESVQDEWRLLGLHAAAGKVKLRELDREIGALRAREQTPELVQQLSDYDHFAASLDKRVGDLQALQHSALQSLPMIRVIQTNNNMLVEKFNTVIDLTLPAWKRQFRLSLSLNEQKNAVELADAIDDATNDFLRANAALLHQNAVATTKANQRLVIDVETLEKVQSTLIQTVQEVIKIQKEGVHERQQAEKRIAAMRGELQARLAGEHK